MGIKKYSDDYEMVDTNDEDGRLIRKAVYRGDYYEVTLDQKKYIQFRISSIILVLIIVVFHISGGVVDNQGMYQFFVSLPYVLGFLPLFNFALGSFLLPKEKRKFRRKEKELSFDKMETASRVLMIFLAIGVLGEIIYILFFMDRTQSIREYLYLSIEVLATAAAYILIRIQRQVVIKLIDEQQRE